MELEKIAVIAEREVALGFKLVGIKDVFISYGEEGAGKLAEIAESAQYSLVIASDSIRDALTTSALRRFETMLKPIVVFIPVEGDDGKAESVEALAKRILGVNIQNVK